MKAFMDEDFLLENETAKKLFMNMRPKCLSSITTATSIRSRLLKTINSVILPMHGLAVITINAHDQIKRRS